MSTPASPLERLTQFQQRDLFSNSAWQARGLNPSANEYSGNLNIFFHAVARELIKEVTASSSKRSLKATFTDALNQLPKAIYDTEEREFIADLFAELAAIVGVDIRHAMNQWLYGTTLATLLTISSFFRRPERVIATRSTPCTQCNTSLKIEILRRREGSPDTDYIIARCKTCGELNLLEPGSGIGHLRLADCEWVQALSKEEYTTHEQALARLQQIKYFRK